jgi:PilZ domain
MTKNPRKSIRRFLRKEGAILSAGSILTKCVVLDVSASGAKIEIQSPSEIPDEFDLLLSSDGKVRRKCHVVRRTEKGIGVRFALNSVKDKG